MDCSCQRAIDHCRQAAPALVADGHSAGCSCWRDLRAHRCWR